MINDCGSCRRLHAAPRGHGAPVDVTLYEANLNETRLQVQGQKKKKKKVNTIMSFNNAFPAHFHPPIIPFWISRETLPTPLAQRTQSVAAVLTLYGYILLPGGEEFQ